MMTRTVTSPARGEAAGLGKSSCLGADDSRVSTILPYRNQAVDRARRRYLVATLHALRPAPFSYYLREAGADVRVTLEEYASKARNNQFGAIDHSKSPAGLRPSRRQNLSRSQNSRAEKADLG
jgi:hypothetical protein